MTNHYLLLELFNSVLASKLQDTQSINFSMGNFSVSDALSESIKFPNMVIGSDLFAQVEL